MGQQIKPNQINARSLFYFFLCDLELKSKVKLLYCKIQDVFWSGPNTKRCWDPIAKHISNLGVLLNLCCPERRKGYWANTFSTIQTITVGRTTQLKVWVTGLVLVKFSALGVWVFARAAHTIRGGGSHLHTISSRQPMGAPHTVMPRVPCDTSHDAVLSHPQPAARRTSVCAGDAVEQCNRRATTLVG